MKISKHNCIFLIILVFTITLLFNSVCFGVAETPKYPTAVIWLPFNWGNLLDGGGTLVGYLDYENDEWTAFFYTDISEAGGPMDCTRIAADSMGWCSGVTYILTHSSDGNQVLATSTDKQEMLDWANGDNGLVVPPTPWKYGYLDLYEVQATPSYCQEHWSDDHNYNKSIVWLGMCGGYSNFRNAVGGQTVFSYNSINADSDRNNIEKIFNYMTGCDGGYHREAYDAFNAQLIQLTSQLICDPNNGSTLAPGVDYRRENDICYPVGSGAGGSGEGAIFFDTKLDTTVDPSLALQWSCISGTATVYNIDWENDHKISFSYCGSPGYSISMTASAYYLRAPHEYGFYYSILNGDRANGNTDDYCWTFSY